MSLELFQKHHKKVIEGLCQAICSSFTIIQIYGLCYVGKTELVKLILKEVKEKKPTECKYICCKENYIDLQELKTLKGRSVIAFDHFDTLQMHKRSELVKFMENANFNSPNITFIIVFKGLKPSVTNRLFTKEFQVLPLGKVKARELFNSVFSSNLNHTCEGLVNDLLDRCCGFPSLICNLAKKLSLYHSQEAIEDCFEKFEIPQKYLKCIENMLKSTSEPVQDLLFKLSNKNVQFTYNNLQDIAEQVNSSVSNYLENPSHVIMESGLLIENENQTYSLQPIIRQVYNQSLRSPVNRPSRSPVNRPSRLPVNQSSRSPVNRPSQSPVNQSSRSPVNQSSRSPVNQLSRSAVNQLSRWPVNQSSQNSFYRVQSSCYAQLNMCHKIGEIILTAERYFQNNKYGQVHKILVDQEDTIQTLFGPVLHSAHGDLSYFQSLYTLCEKGGKVISLLPNQAFDFYQACYDMSRNFGSEEEQAFIQYRMGQSLVKHSVCRNLSKSEEFCKNALKTFQALNLHFKTIKVYITLALISYWKGSWTDTQRYCMAAIKLNVEDRSGKDGKFIKTFCQSILAYNYMCQGFIDEGVALADELLNDPDSSSHPTCGINISSLAWSYYLKGEKNCALELYWKSLAKLQENTLEKNRWVVPMCYIADLSSELKAEHDTSLKMICEAEENQRESCSKHINLSRIYLVKAKILLRKGNLLEAKDILEVAEEIMKESGSVHYILVDIQIWLAHSYLIDEQTDLARKKFEDSAKNLEELHHPFDISRKATVKKHFENRGNCLNMDGCNVCFELNQYNRQAKEEKEEEEDLRNGVRRLSTSECINEYRCPQPESGC